MHLPLTASWRDALTLEGYVAVDATAEEAGPVTVRRSSDGVRAEVTIVPLADESARTACTQHLARWQQVDDPAVDQLVDAVDLGDAVALLRPVDGQELGDLVLRHGRLSAGQTSTLLVVLGRALARLHAGGVVYGPISVHDVRVLDGQPRLVVPAPRTGAEPGLPWSPAEDAYHLASLADAVVAAAYGPDAPAGPAAALRALHRVIVSALGDSASRPGVGTLATASHDVAACQPLVALEPPPQAPPDEDTADARPRPDRRRRRVITLAVAVLALACAGGVWWNHDDPGPDEAQWPTPTADGAVHAGPPADVSHASSDDPASAAGNLTRARFALIARLAASDPDIDARGWSDITVVGSPAHLQALDLVAGLVADGSTVSGLSATVDATTVLESTPTSARVEVVYTTSEYAVRDARGESVVPAATSQRAVLTLARTVDGWRVSDVTPAP